MSISDNEGETWSAPTVINDSYLDDRDAGILNLGGGKLLVSWFCHPASLYETDYMNYFKETLPKEKLDIVLAQIAQWKTLSEEERHGGSFTSLSEDNGTTWSDTHKTPVTCPHGPCLLKDGTIFCVGNNFYYKDKENFVLQAYKSGDNGKTWTPMATIPLPETTTKDNFWEAHSIELPNGRILTAIRYEAKGNPTYPHFTIFTCYSDDGGKSFTTPVCLGILGSPPHLMLHSSGALILSYGRRVPPYGERAVVSYDNGMTWDMENELVIFDNAIDGDLGYPASVELSDKSILTVYYQKYNEVEPTSILFTKWEL